MPTCRGELQLSNFRCAGSYLRCVDLDDANVRIRTAWPLVPRSRTLELRARAADRPRVHKVCFNERLYTCTTVRRASCNRTRLPRSRATPSRRSASRVHAHISASRVGTVYRPHRPVDQCMSSVVTRVSAVWTGVLRSHWRLLACDTVHVQSGARSGSLQEPNHVYFRASV